MQFLFKSIIICIFQSLGATTCTTLRHCVATGRESLCSSSVLKEIMGKSAKATELFTYEGAEAKGRQAIYSLSQPKPEKAYASSSYLSNTMSKYNYQIHTTEFSLLSCSINSSFQAIHTEVFPHAFIFLGWMIQVSKIFS